MNIVDLKINQEGIIVAVNGTGALRHRLLEMGILPNTKIRLVKIAPLGDPIEILIRGYELSIRKADAKLIDVEVLK